MTGILLAGLVWMNSERGVAFYELQARATPTAPWGATQTVEAARVCTEPVNPCGATKVCRVVTPPAYYRVRACFRTGCAGWQEPLPLERVCLGPGPWTARGEVDGACLGCTRALPGPAGCP